VSDRDRLSAGDWQRINDLFHAALERPPAARQTFLDEACAQEPAIRREVASLLAAHDRAEQFLEPAAGASLSGGAGGADESLVGRELGQYRIQRVLGEGGMGVVYLAEDTRLGRTVALKAVSARFTGDALRRDRLRREARSAAALVHPGIATVYALEEFEDQVFIAGEYVPGETLRDELGRGPLGGARALDTALAIARPLAAAHDRGVIHRDLKPENVIRTPAGDVKILDFGLAHFRDLPAALANLTADGTILGTPAYMSPEQIRGGTVDARSDIFALGIVLYELVAGRHPFAGSDPASTIARILESEPARLTTISRADLWNPAVLGELEEVVLTCLRKDPARRYQSVHDLIRALERARGAISSGVVITPPAPARDQFGTPLWWWHFHQLATSLTYAVLLVPLMLARNVIAGRLGLAVFVVGLAGVLTSATLRLHLSFTVRYYPTEWNAQYARVKWPIRLGDALVVLALVVAAALTFEPQESLGSTLFGLAIAISLACGVIEPGTRRAAFRGA
jgi:eukaryotic-like serine/threonine-protein kinase